MKQKEPKIGAVQNKHINILESTDQYAKKNIFAVQITKYKLRKIMRNLAYPCISISIASETYHNNAMMAR